MVLGVLSQETGEALVAESVDCALSGDGCGRVVWRICVDRGGHRERCFRSEVVVGRSVYT